MVRRSAETRVHVREHAFEGKGSITVRDLLRMRSPFEEPPYDRHPDLDWMHAFFLAEGTHMPGTVLTEPTV